MTEVLTLPIIEKATSIASDVAEFGKQNAERLVTPHNIFNCIGAIAAVSSLAHVREGNYFRAAGWAGISFVHMQQRAPRGH